MRKRINNKGFTLIELLAVIVILAIVMVVTIPSVLNAMDGAKKGQLENAMQTVSQWLTKQKELATLDLEISEEYTNFVNAYGIYDSYIATQNGDHNLSNCTSESLAMLEAAGLANPGDTIDLSKTYIWIADNKFAIKTEAKEGGTFYVNNGDNSAFINSGVNDEQFLDGNIFDMSVIASNTTKSGDYWTASYLSLHNKFSRYGNHCGFIGNGECTSFKGQRFEFKENTQYKVTFEGYTDDSTNKVGIFVYYVNDDKATLITFPTSNSEKEANTASGKTVKYIYLGYSGNSNGNVYIKSLKIEEVK